MVTTPFVHRLRVRYAELDPQQVVFNSRYLEYADVIITEFWRVLGVGGVGGTPFECHVRHAAVDFVAPIRIDEEIDGHAAVTRLGTSSLTTSIRLCGAGRPDDLRATITLVHVHVDLATGRPVTIGNEVRALFDKHRAAIDEPA